MIRVSSGSSFREQIKGYQKPNGIVENNEKRTGSKE